MPAGSSAAGSIHDRFSSSNCVLRLGRNSRIGVKPASCSTIRWIVMSLTVKLVRIGAGPSQDISDPEVRLVLDGTPVPGKPRRTAAAPYSSTEPDLDLVADNPRR